MKTKFVNVFVSLGILLFFILVRPGQVVANEPLEITHSLQTYTNDGSTMTITLSLMVQNNGSNNLNNIIITPAPLPKVALPVLEQAATISINNLAAGQSTTIDYTLTSYAIFPEEEIEAVPIFWEISYLDEAGQQAGSFVESIGTTKGGEVQ